MVLRAATICARSSCCKNMRIVYPELSCIARGGLFFGSAYGSIEKHILHCMSFFTKIFGDPNARVVRELQPIVEEINALEKEFAALSDTELPKKTEEFKKRLAALKPRAKEEPVSQDALEQLESREESHKEETLDDILPEAFALVREAAKRTLNQRHFDVQLVGGIVLHQGRIAEMRTGEGKTLTATLPLYLNALAGRGAHLVTVNDYLAR